MRRVAHYVSVRTGGAPITVKITGKEYKRLIESYKIQGTKQIDVIGYTKFTTYSLDIGDARTVISKAEKSD